MARMPRTDFARDLQELQDDLLDLGTMVDEAIYRSLEALKSRDLEASRRVVEDDYIIDQKQLTVEERCIQLIAMQQPLAGDLRTLISVLHIAVDLERVGDYAEGIGKISLLMGEEPPIKPLIDIPRMAEKARQMLQKSLDSLVDRDVELAAQVDVDDDEVDALYDQVYHDLLTYMVRDPNTIQRATYLLWVAHDLERVADRATNIAERVIYLVTGKLMEIEVSPTTVRVREQRGEKRRQSMVKSPFVAESDKQFYQLLENEAGNLKDTTQALAGMLNNYASLEESARKIMDLEHKGDDIIHSIMRRLHGTFVTPLDRGDIAHLAERLDDVVDETEEVARDLLDFRVSAPTPQAVQIARVLAEAGAQLEKAVSGLADMRHRKQEILDLCRSISDLEEEADRIGRQALMDLLNDGLSVGEVMKWREVYHHLEEAADSCQGAAIVLEGIVLEYAV